MSARQLETFLARLLVDAEFRANFLEDPHRLPEFQGLEAAEREALLAIDRAGLCMAARSIDTKRDGRRPGVIRRALDRISKARTSIVCRSRSL